MIYILIQYLGQKESFIILLIFSATAVLGQQSPPHETTLAVSVFLNYLTYFIKAISARNDCSWS